MHKAFVRLYLTLLNNLPTNQHRRQYVYHITAVCPKWNIRTDLRHILTYFCEITGRCTLHQQCRRAAQSSESTEKMNKTYSVC